MRYLSCLIFLLHFGFSGYSQFQLSGTITNEKNQKLTGTHVHTSYRNVASDPIGAFEINGLPKGELRIIVSHLGYQTKDTLVDIQEDLVLNFKMVASETTLKEVSVSAKSTLSGKSVVESTLKSETIEKYSSQTLGDALKEVTGVSLLKTGNVISKPVIHGLHSSRVPIFTNNVRLEDQQWGVEHAPNFDINTAGKITVIKGASGLKYGGDAIGGIVLIEPEKITADSIHGKTIVSLNSNGLGGSLMSSFNQDRIKGWSWNVLGTLKYFGDREAPDYVLSNTGNREANVSGGVSYTQPNYSLSGFYSLYQATIGILSASHIGNATDLYNAINNQVPAIINDFTHEINNPKQEVTHHLAKINYSQKLSDSSDLNIQYAFQSNQRLEFDLRRGASFNVPALDLSLVTNSLLLDYEKRNEVWTFKMGFNGFVQNNYANPATGIRPLIPTYDKFDFGAYGIFEYRIAPDFILETGLRYDFSTLEATKYYQKSRWDERGYTPDFDHFIIAEFGNQWLTKPKFTFHNFSGTIGVRKTFEKNWMTFANLSLSNRNPNPSEYFSDGLHHATGMIELGDLFLDKETSLKVSITASKTFEKVSFEVSPFLNSVANFIYLKPIGFETTIQGAFPVWEYEQTDALLVGIDASFKWDIQTNLNYTLGLAYVYGRDVTANDCLIDMPPLNLSNRLKFSKKEWNGFFMELQSEWVFTQKNFPNNNFGTQIIVDGSFQTGEVDVSTPPPGYYLLNFYTEKEFNLFKKVQTRMAFTVQNILNTNYRDYLNRQRFYADDLGRNIQIQFKFNY